MPPPNNPSVARVALTVQRDTRSFVNVFHMMRTDDAELTSADLVRMATEVADWWQNTYRATVITNVVGESAVATKLDPTDPLQETVFFGGAGTVPTSQAEPGNVTAAFSWRTGFAGRKFRGRNYHVGIDGDQINANDTIVGGYIAVLSAAAAQFLVSLAAESLKLVVFHRSDDSATDITGFVVDQLVDSMRTRLAGRGM